MKMIRLLAAQSLLLLTACQSGTTPDNDSGAAITVGAHVDDQHAEVKGDNHAEDHAEDRAEVHAEQVASTRIAAAVALQSGIRSQPVSAGVIADEHELQGLLTPIDEHLAQASARFAGVIRQLNVGVGERVRAGQTLARIDSNQSLTPYSVTAPIDGVITARHVKLGAAVADGAALFEIADLSQLWVDLHLFGGDAQHIQPGAAVTVIRLSDGLRTRTSLERTLPGMATASQSTIARARIDNADGQWRPGSAIKARVTLAQIPVALMVPLSALQSMAGRDVVFVQDGETYHARRVRLGVRDAVNVEVVDGVQLGEQVVVAESYLIKADLGKHGASHAH